MVKFVSLSNAAQKITATGGGVIEQGKNLTLSYNIDDNKDWFSCTWSRYQVHNWRTSASYCTFMYNKRGTISILKCSPPDFMETDQMEYVGRNKSECAIKVNNVEQYVTSVTFKT